MGSVKLETRNQGRGQREWDYITLSEARVVSALIKNRGKIDPAFYPVQSSPGTGVDVNASSGVFLFSEAIICTYVDLEKLIDTCGLSKGERFTVDKVMLGYTFLDQEEVYGKSRQTFEKLFNRAVEKICKQNNRHWNDVYEKAKRAYSEK